MVPPVEIDKKRRFIALRLQRVKRCARSLEMAHPILSPTRIEGVRRHARVAVNA